MRHLILAVALIGCTKDAKDPPRADPPPRAVVIDAAAAAAPDAAPPVVQLARASAQHAQHVTSAALVVIAADGSLAVGAAPPDAVDLSAIRTEPVAQVGELDARVDAIVTAAPAHRCAAGGMSGGRYGTVSRSSATGADVDVAPPEPEPAGLRALGFLNHQRCAPNEPLVLVDAAAPAARLIEVLSVFWTAQVGVSTDGGAHAAALSMQFLYDEGNRPSDELEIGFTLGATEITASGYKGPTAKRKGWTWRGDVTKLDEALREALADPALGGPVRIRVEPTITAGALIAAVIELLDGGASWFGFGEPVERLDPPRPVVKEPTASVGQIIGDAALDKATVRRYLKRNLAKIKYCYEKQLLATPGLAGTVTLSFTIGADGIVTNAQAAGMDPTVSSCIAAIIARIEFPKPKGGTPMTVASWPITFAPGAP